MAFFICNGKGTEKVVAACRGRCRIQQAQKHRQHQQHQLLLCHQAASGRCTGTMCGGWLNPAVTRLPGVLDPRCMTNQSPILQLFMTGKYCLHLNNHICMCILNQEDANNRKKKKYNLKTNRILYTYYIHCLGLVIICTTNISGSTAEIPRASIVKIPNQDEELQVSTA